MTGFRLAVAYWLLHKVVPHLMPRGHDETRRAQMVVATLFEHIAECRRAAQ